MYLRNRLYYPKFILLCFCILISCEDQKNDVYLNDAIKVSNWLETQKRNLDQDSIWWDLKETKTVSLSMSQGVASKLLFYLNLYNESKDKKYLNDINDAAQYIISHQESNLDSIRSKRNYASLYGNLSGSIFSILEVYKLTSDQAQLSFVQEMTKKLDSLSQHDDGRYWNDFNDILNGASGTGLLLLDIYESIKYSLALDMTREIAETLVKRAKQRESGFYWNVNNSENGMNLPNFSHGTAGVGYFFGRLYELTGEANYLNIAKKAGKYLDEIALETDSLYLLPYSYPIEDWSKDYDLGWAHGPAGAARFYYQMWKITNEDEWLNKVKKSAFSIIKSSFPFQKGNAFPLRDFSYDQRFGLAGIIDFFIYLDRNKLYKNEAYLDDLINELYRLSSSTEELMYWELPGHNFMRNKGKSLSYTGYFYGVSGLGMNLINFYNLRDGKNKMILFSDNPFE